MPTQYDTVEPKFALCDRCLLQGTTQSVKNFCDPMVAEWLGRWTCDQQVTSSTPGLSATVSSATLGKLLTHMCFEQYNLVPANGR